MNEIVAFRDLIKSSVLENTATVSLNSSDIVVNLLLTLLVGLFIFYIYRKSFQGVLYTQSFNVSLVMVSLITSLIIMTISSNLILSLGMVGALSIVRFRTAVKDAMDIGFMFWAISVGIANGAGYFKISIVGSLFIAAVLLVLSRYRETSAPYLLIINYNPSSDELVGEYIGGLKGFKLRSKTISQDNCELTLEVRVKHDHEIVTSIQAITGVTSCVLVSYNGDYVS